MPAMSVSMCLQVWAGNRPLVIVSDYSVVRTIAQQSNERLTSTRYSIMQVSLSRLP